MNHFLQSEPAAGGNQRRRGAMLVLVLVCLPILLAFSVFAINVAWMQLTRTELRTATDAAARAGSRMLSRSQDTDIARARAIEAASRNTVAGSAMIIADRDVEFGNSVPNARGGWDYSTRPDDSNDINATRVLGDRRAGSAAGTVPLLFAGVFAGSTFQPVKTATASQIDRDVVLVLDRSGSMRESTPGGTRWSDLVLAVEAFLNALASTPQDELVGLATYATTSTRNLNMSLDYPRIVTTVQGINPSGNTAIGLGIAVGGAALVDVAFARPMAQKTLVVMTDGRHNTGIDPEVVAAIAYTQFGITVHTITFGAGANQAHMRRVAVAGGGQHWHADDAASLIAVFEEIAANLPTLLTQ